MLQYYTCFISNTMLDKEGNCFEDYRTIVCILGVFNPFISTYLGMNYTLFDACCIRTKQYFK